MTPEQILRAAAKKLRDFASTATAAPWRYQPDKYWNTPGPSFDEEFVGAGPEDQPVCVAGTGPANDDQSMQDAAYIALMHPGVGVALADWLDTAARYASRRPADHQVSTPFLAGALAVAQQILGDQT